MRRNLVINHFNSSKLEVG